MAVIAAAQRDLDTFENVPSALAAGMRTLHVLLVAMLTHPPAAAAAARRHLCCCG